MEKILIIDDNTTIRSFLSDMLRPLGYDVSTASDGKNGLAKALAERPDLILLDFNLPRLSGLEILEALRKENHEVPVILMTAHGSESVAVQAFRLGVRDYLTKPFETEQILGVIEKALTESRLRRERDQLMQRLKQTNRQLERRLVDLSTLYAVGQSVTSLLDLEKLLNRVVEAAAYLTGADEAFLFLIEEGKDELCLRDSRGLSEKWVPGSRLKTQDTLLGTVVTTGKPLALDRTAESRELTMLDHPVSALVNVPLKVKDKTIGVLGVTSQRPGRAFAQDDLSRLAALADYAVIAIENARLHEATKKLVAADILQQTVVTVAHYINNPLTALAMSAHSLMDSAERGQIACHDDSLSEAVRLIEKKVEEIAAVIGILREMASPKSTIYLGETKMIDIREQLAERLKGIEENYKK